MEVTPLNEGLVIFPPDQYVPTFDFASKSVIWKATSGTTLPVTTGKDYDTLQVDGTGNLVWDHVLHDSAGDNIFDYFTGYYNNLPKGIIFDNSNSGVLPTAGQFRITGRVPISTGFASCIFTVQNTQLTLFQSANNVLSGGIGDSVNMGTNRGNTPFQSTNAFMFWQDSTNSSAGRNGFYTGYDSVRGSVATICAGSVQTKNKNGSFTVYQNGKGYGFDSVASLSFSNDDRQLYNSSEGIIFDWQNDIINDVSSLLSADFNARNLMGTGGVVNVLNYSDAGQFFASTDNIPNIGPLPVTGYYNFKLPNGTIIKLLYN